MRTYSRLLHQVELDARNATGAAHRGRGAPTSSWPSKLGRPNEGGRGATVQLYCYPVEQVAGRNVQRSADAAIVREIATYADDYDLVVLFSGDSDFFETMEALARQKGPGTALIVGQKESLPANLLRKVSNSGRAIIDDVVYLCLEYAISGVNPNRPHGIASANPEDWLQRYPVPMGYCPDDGLEGGREKDQIQISNLASAEHRFLRLAGMRKIREFRLVQL